MQPAPEEKPALVFLCQRIPYPPIKGDRIATSNFLRHLTRRYRVFLGTFYDEPGDEVGIPNLQAMVEALQIGEIRRPWAYARALPRWLRGEPLSYALFRSQKLARWLDDVEARHRPVAIVAYSSNIATYAVDRFRRGDRAQTPRILMFADVDSEKFVAYAARARGWMRRIFALEARRVRREESRLARLADVVTLVTDEEAALFRTVHGPRCGNVAVLPNGVDTELFDPQRYPLAPFRHDGPVFMFTGAMDYPPNVEAVGWFADEVFPAIRAALPDAQFLIVGARPAAAVQKLASRPGIVVTGRVESTAAYLAHATVAVAPLQIARGVQNKVLEAMAMACATVVSEGAMTGIAAESGTQCIAAASPGQWADACLTLVRDRDVARRMGDAARRLMIEAYNWEAQFAKLDRMIDTARSRPGQMGAGGNATAPTTGEATVQPMTARGRS